MTTNTLDYVVAAADGSILRWGTCPPDMLAVQAGDGEHAVQGRGRPDTHYVRDGTLCAFSFGINKEVTERDMRRLKFTAELTARKLERELAAVSPA